MRLWSLSYIALACPLHSALPVAVGDFTVDVAINVKPGQRMAVATSSDLDAQFTVATVEKVEAVNATGKYMPAVQHPYLVVDGLVQPL